MKYLWPSLAAISCLALTGCVLPIPSTSQRSPEVRGRVIDAATRQPVANASVALHKHPGTYTLTDSSGWFRLRRTWNVHLLITGGPCGGQWPEGKYYGSELDVTHSGYTPLTFAAWRHLAITNCVPGRCLNVKDIALVPDATRPFPTP